MRAPRARFSWGFPSAAAVAPRCTMSAMSPTAAVWVQRFRGVYVHEIDSYRTGALERVLPPFSRIAEEAEAAADAEFERLGAIPADPDGLVDMADLAEQADGHGQALYETMKGLRQGVRNLLSVGLHHLFEQQQVFFFQHVLATKENEEFQPTKLEERLVENGIDPKTFGCAAKLCELRVAANAIKHGAGRSAQKLAELRPDLFQNPLLAELDRSLGLPTMDKEKARGRAAVLVAPLAGEDLYVTENDLTGWCDAAREYWLELATNLEALQQQHEAK